MYAISGWRELTNAQRLALGIIIIAALTVRLLGISTESLWIDEGASWGFSRLPLAELWGEVPSYEPHPPLYYTLLKFWTMLTGTSEMGLRSLSAVANVITVYLAVVAGRLLLGERATWIALCGAAIFAFHPIQIHFSQEARSYAVQSLGVAMSLVAICWWLKNPAALAVAPRKLFANIVPGSRAALILFIAGATLAIWMHYTGVLLVGSLLALGAILIVIAATERVQVAVNFVLLGALILALWIPVLLFFLQVIGPLELSGHIRPPDVFALGFSFDYLFGPGLTSFVHSITGDYLAAACMGAVAFAGLVALIRRGQLLTAALLCLGTGLPVFVALAASYSGTPAFAERALIWVQIPYVMLIASAALWINARVAHYAALVALVAWFAITSPIERSRIHNEPWRQIVELLEKESGPDDLVLSWYDYSQVPMHFYNVADRIKARRLKVWKTGDEYPTMSAAISPLDRLTTEEVLERVSAALDVKGTVWVVTYSSLTSPIVIGMHEQLKALGRQPLLRTDYILRGTEHLHPPVQLSEYRPAGAR
jgi:uncharacterized membrane protein